ncbi:MAG: hypothetical protein JRE40_00155 [Deltaproteobacteria bacterium]|nr:hypothetical protein [Deltaproteobacteria bacterium]
MGEKVDQFCEQCLDATFDFDVKILETLPANVCQSCFGLIDPELTFTSDDVIMLNRDMLEGFGHMSAEELQKMCETWFGDSDYPKNIGKNLHINIQMIAISKLVVDEARRQKQK